jgi:PIN domain nuclease of toxin-antitoxin system
VIVIDTHIWLWWVNGDPQLTSAQRTVLSDHESTGIGVSAISCWEAAKLAQAGRVRFPRPIAEWMELALGYPGLQVLELTPRIALESTLLPGEFHRDPADQIIVATARVLNCPLVTSDAQILRYPHVERLPS